MVTLKYLFFYLLVTFSLWGCAQTKNIIIHTYATYEVHLPGNIAVDPNGNEIAPRDTIDYIYVETVKGEIQWEKAWKNNQCFSIIPIKIDTETFNAGVNKISNTSLILHVNKGNNLWKLRLIISEKPAKAPEPVGKGIILLKGTYNGKIFIKEVSNQVEINTIPTQ